ncbi:unnamed protein product, partial [Meganyctiphanes norvegica]
MEGEGANSLWPQQEILDHSELTSMIELQLSEIDMLQSMFPGPGEIIVDSPLAIPELKDFVEGKLKELPARLEYSINLDVGTGRLEISLTLPHEYPAVQPDIYVRSQNLNRKGQLELNKELMAYLSEFESGDLSIGAAVTWLQEKGSVFLDSSDTDLPAQETSTVDKDIKFARLWIYSHHLYSKTKRKDILDMANEFDLSGFSLAGKPGIICVEGLSRNTDDWWTRVRTWNWQKIVCKNRETEDINIETDLEPLRRFKGFEELGSDNDIRIKSDGRHVEMGDVFRYLEKHQCGYMFKEYFGIDGGPT